MSILTNKNKNKKMTISQKFIIKKYYENLYKTKNIKELKESLVFFKNRGFNSNNNNRDELELHLEVIKNCIKLKLFAKYN